MQRSGGSGQPVKGQRANKRKPHKSRAPASADRSPEQFERLKRERDEALEQVSATSEILKIISKSPNELEPVFDAMLENTTRICNAKFATLYLCDGDTWRAVAATRDAPPGYVEVRKRNLVQVSPGGPLQQVIDTKQVVHIADLKELRPYRERHPTIVAAVELGGFRTCLMAPMLRDDELVGAISILRQEVRPFTDKQINLLENFAAQAVIAIENARLLNELRQRTDDLSESLEQQTATSEVLKVISSTLGKLEPVFTAMLDNAVRICEAKFGALFLFEGDAWRAVALHSAAPPLFIEARRRHPVLPITPGTALGRVTATKQVVQIADVRAEPAYLFDSSVKLGVETGDFRTVLSVPMLKEGELVGAFNLFHQEVRQFTDKQIELVKNFAAQAVIAIENARLLNELRESLQQQTATADVLQVISSSPGNLEPIFEAILANATQICRARFGTLNLCEGDALRRVALHNAPPQYAMRRGEEFRPHPAGPLGHVVKTKQIAHIEDIRTVQAYLEGDRVVVGFADLAGARTVLAVPMLKEGELVGVITIFRQEVFPFTDKQIELVKNFAAQAVIAIENTRLLNDLNKLNQQLEQRVTDQVSEIERIGRLRRFLPPQVADLIVASGTEKQLESHRREITALFCDLRGFTGFSESSDPEDVMALLREYHAAIGGIINKYGGTLERYAGDGVMVVFNDPIPVDNPAIQAVRMAIDMRAAIGELTEKWRKLGHDIGFGIGIAHGFATLGTIGFEGRFDYAAIGTVSNVASRLCDEAKPGQILISPRVLMAVEKDITVEPVGDFTLKGIRRPLTAYNVLATKAAN
jgi:GAF domain-containing protein